MRIIRLPLIRVFILALSLLLLGLSVVNTDYIHVSGMDSYLNDQVGYISVARNYSETGRLESNIIYPSTLNQNQSKNYLYMPGHYVVLAASYSLLGYSPLNSIIPNLLGYLIASCALFLTAQKVYGRIHAYLATIIFASFPPILIYSFTAMAEITLLAACMLSLCAFVYLPQRWRPTIGPLLLLLPILFKETGALLLLPMMSLMLHEREGPWVKNSLLMILLSVFLVLFVVFSIFSDRPSIMLPTIFIGDFLAVYADAFAMDQVSISISDWLRAIWGHLTVNLHYFFPPVEQVSYLEMFSLWFVLLAIPAGLFVFMSERDFFILGCTVMVIVLFLFVLGLYSIWGFRGVRTMLICLPFSAIIMARLLLSRFDPRYHRKLIVVLLVAGSIFGVAGVSSVYANQNLVRADDMRKTGFLEKIGHNNSMLVAPHWLSMDYVNKHHAVKYSFIPANGKTLKLLKQRYQVGTLVLPIGEEGVTLKPREVISNGFRVEGEGSFRGVHFLFFKRRV